MLRNILLLSALLILAGGILSAQQAATLTAPGPFVLNGAKVDPKGVPSWPVKAGDEITADAVGVTINFPDGSKVTLQPHSKARVEVQNGVFVFRLLECGAAFELAPASTVKLYALDKPFSTPDKMGKYALSCAMRPAGKFWTAKTTALTVGAAGAAASVGLGIAAANGDGSSVSVRQ